MSIADHALILRHHPKTPSPFVHAIKARVMRKSDNHLVFNYRLIGDIGRLLVPAPQLPAPADNLWEHTCFEAFVAIAGEPAYHEFNFSPSGQWAAYAFSDYRRLDDVVTDRLASIASPRILIRTLSNLLELDAIVSPRALPYIPSGATLQFGLSAVVEAADGSRSYWALRHPAAHPDFHLRDAFTFELADPQTSA
jgi:hypothetical protein